MDQVGEQHAQHHGRHERDQQVGGEAPGRGLSGQAKHHVEDLAPEFPHYRQDSGQLDDDVESHGPLAAETDQVGDDDLVAGTGDRQELRQPFDHA
ncbi:hypothetical protein D3C79_696150 [compost metagenome]